MISELVRELTKVPGSVRLGQNVYGAGRKGLQRLGGTGGSE